MRRPINLTSLCATMGLSLIFNLLILPFAAPFASGTSGNIIAPLLQPTGSELPENALSPLHVSPTITAEADVRPSIGSFMRRLTTASYRDDGNWKGGEAKASWLSRLLFQYATPLTQVAKRRRLNVKDVFETENSLKMDNQVSALTEIYSAKSQQAKKRIEQDRVSGKDVSNRRSSLLTQALLLQQRRMLLLTGVLRLVNTLVQAFPALLVSRLLKLVEAGEQFPASKALWAAVTLVAVLSIKMIIENQYFHSVIKISTAVRGSLAGLIFEKSLRLPGGGSGVSYLDARGEIATLGTGGVVNLMQSDAGLIESAALQFHTIWDGPLQIAIYTYLLFRYLGSSVFYGIGVLLLTIPINSVALRILNRLSKLENEAKDARTKRTAESISNMKLLKLQGWANRFADDIRSHRREELRRHVSRGVVRALNTAISNAVPALVLVVTLTAYAKSGKPVVASTIFTAISLFNQLRFPLFFYPILIDSLANGRNAMRRISTYLSAEQVVPYSQHFPVVNGEGGSIELRNGNFLWANSQSMDSNRTLAPALIDVNVTVKAGEVVAVIGSVGSGKSALIKALLGELNPVSRAVVRNAISGSQDEGDDIARNMLTKPSVITYGNVAYCSQEAWLAKGTFREAVVFGRDYDENRFLQAIYDAGLDKDIVDASLPNASKEGVLTYDTDVGEGGSSLSGGQRARVALARALYAGDDTKVFLLDDCLAALDANVGSIVFDRLTTRLRKAGAATVLVTNDPNLPRRCDRVLLTGKIPSGSCATIIDSGTYDELLLRGHNLRTFSGADLDTQNDDTGNDMDVEPPHLMSIRPTRNWLVDGLDGSANCTDESCYAEPDSQFAMENCPDYIGEKKVPVSPSVRDEDALLVHAFEAQSFNVTQHSSGSTKRLETAPMRILTSADDSMSVGAVPFVTYISYFKAVGRPALVIGMIAAYLFANGAQFFQQYTVAKWTEVSGEGIATAVAGKYLRSLVNAAGVVSVFLWIRSFVTMQVGVKASEFYHSRMLNSVFHAPMSFFDATPSGQLLSRFGKEMETIDRGVPDSISSVLFCFLQIFFSMAALAGVVTAGMLVPLVLVSILYIRTMGIFRPAARDMKREETRTRSPIFTHFSEALRGTEIIRSVPGSRQTWAAKHKRLSDANLSVFYTVKALDRWLATRLETLGNLVVFTAAVASVLLTRAGTLKSGSAGWGLTQALAITGLLTWAVRCLTDLETSMMSVLRVQELTNIESEDVDVHNVLHKGGRQTKPIMPSEPARPGEALKPLLSTRSTLKASLAPIDSNALISSGWPWRGNVRFYNVSMRYNPAAPLVLRGITLTVPAGTTLGVVGRTGSGKSSLLLTLFRLAEIELGGSIEVDGVDIRSVALESLRQSLAIIPQDPVLFAGTLAYNLDATGAASDADMWAALESSSPSLAVQFRQSDGLTSLISEGGKNLSLGQRQLICLARALLRNSRLLVLDEATSSVDPRTDQEVQETIRREFVDKGVTVITVAHRLETVLGYDKIAVLGNGEVVEYGSPEDLLRKPGGELRRLVDADQRSKKKGAQKKLVQAPLVAAL